MEEQQAHGRGWVTGQLLQKTFFLPINCKLLHNGTMPALPAN
jgi:hypothetical protein